MQTPDITLGELRVARRRDGVKRAHEVMAPIAQALIEEQQIVVGSPFRGREPRQQDEAPRRTNTRVAIFAGTI